MPLWKAGWTAWKKSGRGKRSSMTFSAVSLRGLAKRRNCWWISTRSCSTGLCITQRSIRTAGGGSPSATAWRLAQRSERKQRAGSGDFRISCPLFLRVLFLYAPHISYYHSVSHVPDIHTDNGHGELVPACSLDKSTKSAIFKIVKKLTVRQLTL